MELHEIHLPSVADYVAAFQATEARITPKRIEHGIEAKQGRSERYIFRQRARARDG